MSMIEPDLIDSPAKRGRPRRTPKEAARILLDAIENAEPAIKSQWDRAVIDALDMPPNDLILGLRKIATTE